MQLKKLVCLTAIAAAGLMLTGCASIISGTHQDITINSAPQSADVRVESLTLSQNTVTFEGKTPAKTSLARKGSYLVTISMNGYEKAQVSIDNGGMNGWVWGNIVLGGLVGILIDISDGAAMNLQPGDINVTLVAQKSTQRGDSDGMSAVLSTAGLDGKTVSRSYALKAAGAR